MPANRPMSADDWIVVGCAVAIVIGVTVVAGILAIKFVEGSL